MVGSTWNPTAAQRITHVRKPAYLTVWQCWPCSMCPCGRQPAVLELQLPFVMVLLLLSPAAAVWLWSCAIPEHTHTYDTGCLHSSAALALHYLQAACSQGGVCCQVIQGHIHLARPGKAGPARRVFIHHRRAAQHCLRLSLKAGQQQVTVQLQHPR